MSSSITNPALYTTIYPQVRPFLKDWFRSVQAQTDQDFQVWIGLDQLSRASAMDAMGGDPHATWVEAVPGESPARIRQRAFTMIASAHDAVVLVDSDDILHPTRAASAIEMLKTHDLAGCALRLVDQQGRDMGMTFGLPRGAAPDTILPRNNVFGLSNTAYRTDLLQRCLPIPEETVVVDWLLATRAWLMGARLAFDENVRMDYRQHGSNMTHVRPPFNDSHVMRETEQVRRHFRIVTAKPLEGALPRRIQLLRQTAEEIEVFHNKVVFHPDRLARYVEHLNALNPQPLWWLCVANPSLRAMWT